MQAPDAVLRQQHHEVITLTGDEIPAFIAWLEARGIPIASELRTATAIKGVRDETGARHWFADRVFH